MGMGATGNRAGVEPLPARRGYWIINAVYVIRERREMADSLKEKKLKVVIVEDEHLFRDLLRVSLSQSGRIEVVGDFADGESALDGAPALRPDVAILDIELRRDGLNGIQTGLLLKQQQPDLGIVLLSNHREPAFLSSLTEGELAGWSYLLKGSVTDVDSLARAIVGAAEGYVILDPQLIRRSRPRPEEPLARLTPRQLEVLELIAQGWSNTAIGGRLAISRKSVENQINAIFQILGIEKDDISVQPRVRAVLKYLQQTHLRERETISGR